MNKGSKQSKIDHVSILFNPTDISSHIAGEKKSLVLFEMTGCPYCRAFETRFLDFAVGRLDDLHFLKVKLDDPGNPLWAKYKLIAVPTVIAFSRGETVARADSILAFGLSKRKWTEFCAAI
jgi:thiol-disulfide isomerase/thioredoxin